MGQKRCLACARRANAPPRAHLVPSDSGRMCTFTNEDIIALGCITTKAMNTNNVFIFAFMLISHGFLKHGWVRKTLVRTKGIGVIIHALHELSLRAKGTQVQISQQPLQILLPSAVHLEERLTVSQSVPEPASRQSDRYTQFGFFVSSRYGTKQQGGPSLESR